MKFVKETPDEGLTFRPGLQWPSPDQPILQLCMLAVSDASHGNEDEWVDDWQVREPFRSLGGKAIFLGSMDAISGDHARVHVVSFGSSLLKRVVNSTMKAETYQMTEVQDSADTMRAAFADCHIELKQATWEKQASEFMKSVWFTDCRSLYDSLQKPVAKSVEKRLGIDLAGLRQFLWRVSGEDPPPARTLEEKPALERRTDYIRWVDTMVMCADVFTKRMREEYLMQVIGSNVWNFAQPEEGKAIKHKKKLQRQAQHEVNDQGEVGLVESDADVLQSCGE